MHRLFILLLFVLSLPLGQAFGQANRPVASELNPGFTPTVTLPPSVTEWGAISYVRTYTPLVPLANASEVNTSKAASQVAIMTSYVDGLGRPLQEVVRQEGPNGEDLVKAFAYDAYGREVKTLLPYAVAGTTEGKYQRDFARQQLNYYQQGTGGVQATDYPYGEKVFESSPRGRVLQEGGPGEALRLGQGHEVSMAEFTSKGRYHWTIENNRPVAGSASGTPSLQPYANNSIWRKDVTNAQGYISREFYDKRGRLLVSERQIEAPLTGPESWAPVIYVYDDLDRLRFVIQPQAFQIMNGTADGTKYNMTGQDFNALRDNDALFNDFVFAYQYDDYGRLIKKKIPGAEWEYMVYDQHDRLVLTQDGRQRSKNEWAYTAYDLLGRIILNGLYTHGTGLDQAAMQQAWDNGTISPEQTLYVPDTDMYTEGGDEDDVYEGESIDHAQWNGAHTYRASERITLQPGFELGAEEVAASGFNAEIGPIADPATPGSDIVPGGELYVLTRHYYDDYDFDDNGTADIAYQTPGLTGYDAANHPQAWGLPTGSKTTILGTDQQLTTAVFYDSKDRILQEYTQNVLGGEDVATHAYSFTGNATQTHLNHTGGESHTVQETFTYDNAQRLTQVTHKLDDHPAVTLSAHQYNALGQEVQRKLQVETNGDALQTVDYAYTPQGWLAAINDPLAGNAQATGDYFAMRLYYDQGFDEAQYGGNVAGTVWSGGQPGDVLRAYGYRYDPMDRLTHADYVENADGAGWTGGLKTVDGSVQGYYDAEIGDYDYQGNIGYLKRMGALEATHAPTASEIGWIDNLTYTYQGNQLLTVEDAAQEGNAGSGFKNGHTSGGAAEYAYDDNGALTEDKNKGITTIKYNHLNLVEVVRKNTEAWIEYDYDAAGQKLAQRVYSGGRLQKQMAYVGKFIFEDTQLEQLHHNEGKVLAQENGIQYQFYLKDPQGNIRTVVQTPEEQVLQATFETGAAIEEEAKFENLGNIRHSGASTARTGNASGRLNSAQPTGAKATLAVNPGDQVVYEGYAMYVVEEPGGINMRVVPFMQLSPIRKQPEAPQGGQQQATLGFMVLPKLQPQNTQGGTPDAYLKYRLVDAQGQELATGNQPISGAAQNNWEALSLAIDITQAGTLELFIANETGATDVYFDDLKITHTPSPVVQETHYYPFGEKVQALSVNNGSENNYLYNGKELQADLGIDWYDYGARMYDAQLGRFHRIDRFAEKYMAASVYGYVMNNPLNAVDVNGDSIVIVHKKQRIVYHEGKLTDAKTGKEYVGKRNKNGELKGFVGKTSRALDAIRNGGDVGESLINDLENDQNNIVTIEKSGSNSATGLAVKWNPSDKTGGLDVAGGNRRPAFIGLAHELAHAWDKADDGIVDYGEWFTTESGDVVRNAEKFASHMENKIRAENNVPLRAYYTAEKYEDAKLLNNSHGSLHYSVDAMIRINPTMSSNPKVFSPSASMEVKGQVPYRYK